jgi:uncharacterized LabA/DUF88 family protein
MSQKPNKPNKPNVYAFIDSQNLNLGVQRMGWKLDWRKFRQHLLNTYHVTRAYMFIGYMSENESMYEYMHELGFLVVLKPTVDVKLLQKAQGGGGDNAPAKESDEAKPAVKGNVDAELVLYAMKELPNYDKAIIVSGDGDFFSLAEYLDDRNKLLHILTPNWQYSSLLKVFESKIVRLDQYRRQLSYHDRRPKKKQDDTNGTSPDSK